MNPGEKIVVNQISVSYDDLQIIPVKGDGQTVMNYRIVFTATNNMSEYDFDVNFKDFVMELDKDFDNSNLSISPALGLQRPIKPGESVKYEVCYDDYKLANNINLNWQVFSLNTIVFNI